MQSALFDARQLREEADSRTAPSAADLAVEERDALALRVRCPLWTHLGHGAVVCRARLLMLLLHAILNWPVQPCHISIAPGRCCGI